MITAEERQAYLFIIEMIRQATTDLKVDNDRSEEKWVVLYVVKNIIEKWEI